MTRSGIPQTNPLASYLEQRDEIHSAVERVLTSGYYILGPEVKAFEAEFARVTGTSHCIGVSSGTDALHLALRAAGVGEGDLVVTVSNTAVATAAAIEMSGASLAFVDVDADTLTMSAQSLESFFAESKRPLRAVVPVHLFGRPAPMRAILDVATRYNAIVVEDCAQAHGATIEGRPVGSFGQVSAFSFYPTKNLSTFGDGGAICTNDTSSAERALLLRQYGWRERNRSDIPGFNCRLDELHAAILRVRLRHLQRDNVRRIALASRYDDALAGNDRIAPLQAHFGHVYHQYVIRSRERDRLRQYLAEKDVQTLIHYPVPIHLQPAYRGRVAIPVQGLPETERAAREILSLPMFPQMTAEQERATLDALKEWASLRA